MNYKTKVMILRLIPRWLRKTVIEKYYRREINITGEIELLQLEKIVKRGDLALDIGSNIGVYTYRLHRLTGHVIAFEPNPTLAALIRSVSAAGVDVREIALSSQDGTAELSIPLDPARGHGWASVIPGFVQGPVEKISVSTRRLDGLDLGRVSFIKIDVEGAELLVLDGAKETLARDRPVLLIEIGAADLESTVGWLAPYGYQAAFFRKGAWHSLDEFDPAQFQSMDKYREDMKSSPTRRELDFINNFLFLPPSRQLVELN